MTKAELLHRFRWLFVILTFAIAAGFQVLSVMASKMPPPVASGLGYFLLAPVDLRVGVWLLIAFFCSVHTAWWVAVDNGLMRGLLGYVAISLMTIAAFGTHIMVSSFLLLICRASRS